MQRTLKPISLFLLAVLFSLTVAVQARAQASDPDLREEVEALKKGQEQIQKDLAEIKKLLQTRAQPQLPAAPDVSGKSFDLGDNPVVGEPSAKLTLVEFTDYQ